MKSIAKYVETRNSTQVRTHAQKYFLRMKKEDPDQYARYVEDDPDEVLFKLVFANESEIWLFHMVEVVILIRNPNIHNGRILLARNDIS